MKHSSNKSPKLLSSILAVLLILVSSMAFALPQPRIIGGTTANPGAFPWQIAIIEDPSDPFWSQSCGGTLVHERWIISAAHCFVDPLGKPNPAGNYYVVAGINDLRDTSGGQLRQATRIILHPDYDNFSFDNDIALVELSAPINLAQCGSKCRTLDLVTPELVGSVMPASTRALISGWGNRTGGENPGEDDYPELLEFAELFIVDCLAGTRYNPSEITQNMFCAGVANFRKDACQGDSGGPLVVADNSGTNTMLLAGVVSWGEGCAINSFPGVYTKVANYTQWIHTNTNGECCNADSSNNGGGDSNGQDGNNTNGGNAPGTEDPNDNVEQPTKKKKKSGSFTWLGVLGLFALASMRRRSITTAQR